MVDEFTMPAAGESLVKFPFNTLVKFNTHPRMIISVTAPKELRKLTCGANNYKGRVALTVATITARNILVVNGCKNGATWQDVQ